MKPPENQICQKADDYVVEHTDTLNMDAYFTYSCFYPFILFASGLD